MRSDRNGARDSLCAWIGMFLDVIWTNQNNKEEIKTIKKIEIKRKLRLE